MTVTNRASLRALAEAGYDLDGVQKQRVFLYVDGDELEGLRQDGWNIVSERSASAQPNTPSGYHDYTNLIIPAFAER